MNNQQFRRLVYDTPSSTNTAAQATPTRNGGATPMTLGSRMRSSIPMTPRSLSTSSGVDFAKQLRERNATTTTRKFRSSAAPKGTKLAAGYQDRTRLRDEVAMDDKATRVKALEDMVKLGQMEYATFEALRDEIVGGDVANVHLVKGLDRRLLERVRRGEDVLAERVEEKEPDEAVPEANVDEAFENLEKKEIRPLVKDEKVKKGEMAPPPPIAGKKRSRNEILAELKASRLKAAEAKKAQAPVLGPKFKPVGAKQDRSRIERDEKGREVLITVDEDGNVKRKVKKIHAEEGKLNGGLLMPDKNAKPLGMEVPDTKPAEEPADDDMDIFQGVGNDYDPLGILEDSDSDSDSESRPTTVKDDLPREKITTPASVTFPPTSVTVSDQTPFATQPRNYFSKPKSPSPPASSATPLHDPTILAALRKASTLAPAAVDSTDPEAVAAAERAARHARMLAGHDRDAEDMDLGFGSSRFEDGVEAEEGEGKKIRLSVWRGGAAADDDEDADGKRSHAKKERKRGGGKKKGDKNSAGDVLGVIERRKAAA